jgi:hypothetical protein
VNDREFCDWSARSAAAAVLQDWLALPAAGALGGRFDPLPVIRT